MSWEKKRDCLASLRSLKIFEILTGIIVKGKVSIRLGHIKEHIDYISTNKRTKECMYVFIVFRSTVY